MIKKTLMGLGLVIAVLACVLVVNTLRYLPDEVPSVVFEDRLDFDKNRLAENLASSIRFKTISHQNANSIDRGEFESFLRWLRNRFPMVHSSMELQFANELTPIFKWVGDDDALQPVLLTGHYDVVPVLPSTIDQWEKPPFAGIVSDGFIWGRGALDDKIAVVGLLEAAEKLLSMGLRPKRTIYFVFGHDEEVSGKNGAIAAVDILREQGVQFLWALDEGSMVLDGLIKGIEKPIASINVAEKGYLTLDLRARSAGGHSSLPPRETAVGILANALVKLQDNPVPGGLTDVTADFFEKIGRNFSFGQRLLFANTWLFGPLIETELAKAVTTNALLRTTTAPTMLSASSKENVLAAQAVATINFRLHPRDSIESVKQHVIAAIGDDRIKVNVRSTAVEASPVSSHEDEAFAYLSDTFRKVFGDIIVVPGLTIAATDARHYAKISDNTYRINPVMFGPDDISRIHGANERISVDGYAQAVQFYAALIAGIK